MDYENIGCKASGLGNQSIAQKRKLISFQRTITHPCPKNSHTEIEIITTNIQFDLVYAVIVISDDYQNLP
ncbi:hypothetical protein L1987_43087 [Smallanthus sonchifolius]|uniref:Uncharacterized protein n=1 Tax=Smallanthus sonchifolius TaxID=185202 RepID=A0ACB9GLD5_9ASTR|nr:hypothetical protein L1987_43087 [Smallanthus sonchifolius]